MAAGAFYFCRHKSNQKGLSAEMLLRSTGLCPANQIKPRAAIFFADLPFLISDLLCKKFAMPLPALKAPMFYLISPEALLLKRKIKLRLKYFCYRIKSG
jgi:hypothetical protein|nr:hypothetical protein [Mucilaginibacter sp. X4EP1]